MLGEEGVEEGVEGNVEADTNEMAQLEGGEATKEEEEEETERRMRRRREGKKAYAGVPVLRLASRS